jgi:hypothetical protein
VEEMEKAGYDQYLKPFVKAGLINPWLNFPFLTSSPHKRDARRRGRRAC